MRWTIYERPTGREIMQIDAPNHPAAIAAAKLTGLDGEAIGARVGARVSVAEALSIFEAACGVEARVRRIDTGQQRQGRDRIFIEYAGSVGEPFVDAWVIRCDGSNDIYGRGGWESRWPSATTTSAMLRERCSWTLEEALRAVEAMRDDEPVAGGAS